MLILMALGLCITDLSVRMIISGLCSRRFPTFHPTTIPLFGYAALLAVAGHGDTVEGGPLILGAIGREGVVSHRTCLSAIVGFETCCLFWLLADTINKICAVLEIPFLAPVVQ